MLQHFLVGPGDSLLVARRDPSGDFCSGLLERRAMDEQEARAPRPVVEVLVAFAATTAATVAVTLAASVLPGLDGYVPLLVGGIFLTTAVKLSQRETGGMRRFGIDLAGVLTPPDPDDARPPGPLGLFDLGRALRDAAPSALRETSVAVGLALVIFPIFAVGFWLYNEPAAAFRWSLPEDFGEFALTQLVVVALPEEALFRGWMQTRLADRWPAKRRILGVEVDLRVLLLQSALFAVLHFASIPSPERLAVFFPVLLFGGLRAWRGGIGAAMLFHALCNVLARLLEHGWSLV
jgi:membrane protease YdiL (CAAX protease family)